MTARIHAQPRHHQRDTRATTSSRASSSASEGKNCLLESESTVSAAAVVAAVARLHQQQVQLQQALFDPESSNSPNTSPCTTPSPSPKLADGRKASKPLMEKRRRARINQSLAALKALILDSARLENTKHSKLEKADILELTVRHLQRQRSLAQPGLSRYKAGYQDCSREVSRYLDAPDIITGNTVPIDPAFKQRLVRHLDSCVSELDLDLGSRPDSGLGSSPGSITDRVLNPASPIPGAAASVAAALHCNAALGAASLVKTVEDIDVTRPDGGAIAPGDENNNSSRPTSAFAQIHPSVVAGVDPLSAGQPDPNMLSVVQVIPSRLPDGQVVFLLPSHYLQLAAAAAANGICIGPNPPAAIWATTNMALLKETDKLLKRPLCDDQEDWTENHIKPSKSPRIDSAAPVVEQPLDFTTSSAKKLKAAAARYVAEQQQQQQQQQQKVTIQQESAPVPQTSSSAALAFTDIAKKSSCSTSSSSQSSSDVVGVNYVKKKEIKQEVITVIESDSSTTHTTQQVEKSSSSSSSSSSSPPPPPPVELQQIKDEENMWRPW